ncbi:MAG: PaaI family thioesterase [Xanthomonadales bacterium]|nr:PaaI family thioesterase [Xanthomonadales bacterium]
MKAFQDHYPEELSHCYGCGRNNPQGNQLKSHWDTSGKVTVASFTPKPHHTVVSGYVYGGLIASLIDCHGAGSAAAAAHRAEGREMGREPLLPFVTASLQVDFLVPTPQGEELTLRGEITELGARKVIVDVTLSAAGQIRARGRVIAVKMPAAMGEAGTQADRG